MKIHHTSRGVSINDRQISTVAARNGDGLALEIDLLHVGPRAYKHRIPARGRIDGSLNG